jgi:hypothetical protein
MVSPKTSIIAIVVAMVFASGIANNFAYAVNPYVAGYPTTSTITIHSQYTMKNDFTDVAGPRNQNLGQVFSTAGWASTTATDPTGWTYQHAVDLLAANTIFGEQQVYNGVTCMWHCPITTSNSILLGNYGTASSDIQFVYSTYYWNTGRTGVNFYYEPHFNDGSLVSKPIATYTKGASDTSNYFASGTKSKTIGSNTYLVKFFQFGVESNDSVNTAWNAKQYEMNYAGTSPYSALTTKSTTSNTSPTTGSWISYSGTSVFGVGASQYNANADYHAKAGSTLPSGTVKWYQSSTPITPGTQLWP